MSTYEICTYMSIYVHIYAENQKHQMVMNSFPALCSMHNIGYKPPTIKHFHSRENSILYITYSPSRQVFLTAVFTQNSMPHSKIFQFQFRLKK